MSVITVWNSQNGVRLHQLSEDPSDGTSSEQIAVLAAGPYSGFTCVSEDYTGPVPDAPQMRWDGTQLVAYVRVPEVVSPRQVRLLLLSQGLLENVKAMIAQQDEATQITWEYAEEFRRDNPLLNQLAANLGLTDQQIDEFFVAAAAL